MAKQFSESSDWRDLIRDDWPENPTPQRREMLRLCVASYVEATSEQQAETRRNVSRVVIEELPLLAHAFAEESIRQRKVELVVLGMATLAIGDERLDYRDVITALSLLFSSARKLGASEGSVVATACCFSSEHFTFMMEDFVSRDLDDKNIYEMGYKENGYGSQFKYERHFDF